MDVFKSLGDVRVSSGNQVMNLVFYCRLQITGAVKRGLEVFWRIPLPQQPEHQVARV